MQVPEPFRFVCPICQGALIHNEEAYRCVPCQRAFPIVLGIPDFRVFPDPYISMEDDWSKGRRLKDNGRTRDFQATVASYYAMTPEVPPELAARYVRYVMTGPERGRTLLDAMAGHRWSKEGAAPQTLLEIGCGTGGLLIAARERFAQVIGVDIAFRWLVIAQKRFAELGVSIPLVCCCGEYLPFPPEQFERVVASDVLEHSRQPERILQESARVLKADGLLFLSTQNRFTLRPEPCVRVWGVGFLPRRWMSQYVRWVRKIPYEHVRLLSCFELRRLLYRAGFRAVRLLLPGVSPRERAQFSQWERIQATLYETVKRLPLARYLWYLVGPAFWALGRKRPI